MKELRETILRAIKDLNRFWDLRKTKDIFLLYLAYIDSISNSAKVDVDFVTTNYNEKGELYVGADPKGVSIVLNSPDKTFFNNTVDLEGYVYRDYADSTMRIVSLSEPEGEHVTVNMDIKEIIHSIKGHNQLFYSN